MGTIVTWKSGSVEIWKSGPGELAVRDGDRIERMFAATAGDVVWIFRDGVTYRVEAPSASRRRGRDTHGALSAPMPATVVAVKVAPGDQVVEGQTLIVLEAMKMELPVRAPGNGRIKAVCCKAGDLVQPDVSLIEFE